MSWQPVALKDLAVPKNGITDGPFGSNLKSEHYTESGPRVIRLQNIGDGQFIDEHAHIGQSHFKKLLKHEAKAGDVIIALLGEKLPRACVVPPSVGPAIVKADCARFRPDPEKIDSHFLCYWLNWSQTRQGARGLIKGVGRPRMNLKQLKGLELEVPPLNDQLRIVERIDSLFSDIDGGLRSLEQAKQKITAYRASVLKAATTGTLTADWRQQNPVDPQKGSHPASPNAEPADRLLSRLLLARRNRWEQAKLAEYEKKGKTPPKNWQSKYKPPVKPEAADLSELPPGWCWATLDMLLVEKLANGISIKASPDQTGVPALRLDAMSNSGFDYSCIRHIPIDSDTTASLQVEDGDFYVSRGNGSLHLVGRGTSASDPPRPLVFPDTMIRVRLLPQIAASGWVRTVWPSRMIRQQIEREVKTTAGIWKIAQPQLAAIMVPLPPLAEQREIVDRVEERLSVADAASAAVAAAEARAARLRQSILRDAFTGRLTATADGVDTTSPNTEDESSDYNQVGVQPLLF